MDREPQDQHQSARKGIGIDTYPLRQASSVKRNGIFPRNKTRSGCRKVLHIGGIRPLFDGWIGSAAEAMSRRRPSLVMTTIGSAAVSIVGMAQGVHATNNLPETRPQILSAYYGLNELPVAANALCGTMAAGQDGLPVVFSTQLNGDTVSPEAFVVETADGDVVTPVCATLRPATEPLERGTVLLAGPFGTPEAQPRGVAVVGGLEDTEGNSLVGLRLDYITPLEAGPSLVLAERFDPDVRGLEGECPGGTAQVVQLTWEGGVSGPHGAALGNPQLNAITITLANGEHVTPVALGDDDPDNYVLACVDAESVAVSVSIRAGFFHDPGDDANPQTSIGIAHSERN